MTHLVLDRHSITHRWKELAVLVLLGLALATSVAAGGELVLLAAAAVGVLAALTVIAYRYPVITVGTWLVASQLLWELANTGFIAGQSVRVGAGIDLRYTDPVLLGMAGAMLVQIVRGERADREVFTRTLSLWTLLVAWLLFQAARSLADYSLVNVLGELRTSFGPILALPYVLLFFKTSERQMQLLRLLIALVVALMGVGLLQGALVYNFGIGAYLKWLGAHSTAAVLFGAVALFLVHRHGAWPYRESVYAATLATAIGLIVICSHRSVWMASGAALMALVWTGHISLSKPLKIGAVLVVSLLLVDLATADLDVMALIHERLGAFYRYDDDATASWRLQIWANALQQSSEHWLLGKGLGSYFNTATAHGQVVTVSLHNQYVQFVYQTGVLSLVLYVGLLLQTARLLVHSWHTRREPVHDLLVSLALTVLSAVAVYYLAYYFDYVSWMFIGLGLAAATSATATPRYASHPYAESRD